MIVLYKQSKDYFLIISQLFRELSNNDYIILNKFLELYDIIEDNSKY